MSNVIPIRTLSEDDLRMRLFIAENTLTAIRDHALKGDHGLAAYVVDLTSDVDLPPRRSWTA